MGDERDSEAGEPPFQGWTLPHLKIGLAGFVVMFFACGGCCASLECFLSDLMREVFSGWGWS